MSTIAVFLALGGVSYAAITIPVNSVGSRQIIDRSVGTNDLADRSLTSSKIALGTITTANMSAAAVSQLRGAKGDPGPAFLAYQRFAAQVDSTDLGTWTDTGDQVTVDVTEGQPVLHVYGAFKSSSAGCAVVNGELRFQVTSPSGAVVGSELTLPDTRLLIATPWAQNTGNLKASSSRVSVAVPAVGRWTFALQQRIKSHLCGEVPVTYSTKDRQIWVASTPLVNG